jgi:hypothetical protein
MRFPAVPRNSRHRAEALDARVLVREGLQLMSARTVSKLLPLVALCALATALPAAAQNDEGPSELQKLFGAAGLLELPKDPIDYQERSPFVVPPSAVLPPPSNVGDVAKLNPEWPADPDWRRARDGAAQSKISPEDRRGNFYPGGNVKVEDMSRVNPAKPDKKKGNDPSSGGGYATAGEEAKAGADRYSPSQLGFQGWGKKDSVSYTGEPERSLLTEPPAGYRVPSPNAPYGVVEEKSKYGKTSVFDRLDDPNTKK